MDRGPIDILPEKNKTLTELGKRLLFSSNVDSDKVNPYCFGLLDPYPYCKKTRKNQPKSPECHIFQKEITHKKQN